MKYSINDNLSKFILFILTVLILSNIAESRKTSLYPKNGKDWPGVCGLGKFQSPINIIDGVNTIDDSKIKLIFSKRFIF